MRFEFVPANELCHRMDHNAVLFAGIFPAGDRVMLDMIEYMFQNIGTILVALVLLAVVFVIIRKLIKDKKAGKSSCGCDCSHCGMCGSCHESNSLHG